MYKLTLLAFVGLLLCAESALACMCGDTPSVAKARRDAHLVFSGKALSSEYQESAKYPNGKDAGEELTMRFRVERWWKGNLTPEVVLFTERYRMPDLSISVVNCAYQFEVGKRYIVYAVLDGKLRAAYCSRTSAVEEAREDLRLLGQGRKPRRAAGRIPQRAKPNNGTQRARN
ncbi:MAG TPA: hypothetical protein VGW12_19110 [Pyrinomonadaceae bacterium]|nr:hypothetical protein [Pyrinomonadaceae bacterium]